MKARRRTRRAFALQVPSFLIILLMGLGGCAHSRLGAPPALQVEDASGKLPPKAVREFEDHAREAAGAVFRCLGKSDARAIRVVLDEKARTPFTEDPAPDGSVVIRLPAGRLLPGDVAASKLALHHELTHAIAAGRRGDRLLAEGLGVHMQDLLGNASYPDFERTPAQVVAELERSSGRIPLADSEVARRERPTGDERRLAYAQEGAFVRWLIGSVGLDRFLRLYEGDAAPDQVLGASWSELEARWRQSLAAGPGPAADRRAYCRR